MYDNIVPHFLQISKGKDRKNIKFFRKAGNKFYESVDFMVGKTHAEAHSEYLF